MKAIQLLVNSVLPDDLKNYEADFSDKGLNKILYAVANKHPDKFAQVLKDISDIGRKVSYQQGETLNLQDLAPVIDREAIYNQMESEIKALPKDKDFIKNRRDIFQKYNEFIEKETSKNALQNKNNIAISVLSGARGKSAQLKAMISTPGTFSDYKGTPIDVFSKESFADGIRPVTFLASTYGARSSVISTKSSTAKGGDLAKQMAQSVVDMVIREQDCGSYNGIALPLDDESLKGRVLSQDTGGYKAGSFITREMINDLSKKGISKVVARSPLTCGVHNGLCAKCVGKFYKGNKLPKIGEAIGAMASTAASEPVTQMALSAKHTAGMTTSKRTYSGLGTIAQFTQSPEKFKDRAAVSEVDGKVEKIEDASQGGLYITVGGIKHYVPAGHQAEVKIGDSVEAGDFLSEGLGDAEEVVKYKGLGAGRLYYANRLHQILADSGAKNDKRSIEVLARGALRHVRITDDNGYGNYLPDDVVDYNVLQSYYKMPLTTKISSANDAVGKYLQAPALHYTIGTKITPKVAKDLSENNYSSIYVDDSKPSFEPEMIRLRASSHTNPDWMASLGTSYLTKQLNESSTKGDITNVHSNADYRPRLAFGKDFGKNVEETGLF